MEQAWLDSLSEDWISQPRSSGSPVSSLPSLSNSTYESRIPKHNSQQKAWPDTHDSGNNALAERSPSENNISASQRAFRRPSKLRDEISNSASMRRLSQTLSASTTQSVQCHTVQHHGSVNISPTRGPHETPEWKKRLLHGDVAYGEQRDLFSPAGLEGIFRPPPAQPKPPIKFSSDKFEDGNITMPSSPPPYKLDHGSQRVEEARGPKEQLPERDHIHQQLGAMKYNLVDLEGSEFSANDLTRSSSFRPIVATSQEKDEPQETVSYPASNFSEAIPQRIISGQSVIRNEELSPIYISRHNTGDGKIDYAARDLSTMELDARLNKVRAEDQLSHIDNSSQALQGNSVPTDDYAYHGRFINFQRGGYSQEGSFQKRMLSPSSPQTIDESALLPEESMQASTPKQLPNMRKTRTMNELDAKPSQSLHPLPPAPHPSPVKSNEIDLKSSAGSPLKIFGAYDTFTNQKLLRRLSQFEEHFDNHKEDMPSNLGQESTHPGLNDDFVEASSLEKESEQTDDYRHNSRKLNSFGRGDLDDFQFNEEISYNSSGVNPEDEDKENVSLPVLDPTRQTRFKFQLEPSPALEEGVILSQRRTQHVTATSTKVRTITVRKKIRPVTGSSDTSAALPPSQRQEDLATPRKREGNAEGKRLFQSPPKDPTPKRRRTLHKSDMAEMTDDEVETDLSRENRQQMQSVIGKKRKDARHDDDHQAANPKVLARRQILRPRTPTASQRSSLHAERAPLQEMDLALIQDSSKLQQQKIAKIQAELDSTDLQKPLTSLGMSQQMQDGSRKGSVTTQDFLDEAKKIMAGIRGKARPRSGLTSLEESESDNDRKVSAGTATQDEDSYQESTQEPFSRPPSREGGPVSRPPAKQQDPELLDHLRKYEEMGDMDEVIASSIRSIAMAKDAAISARELDRIAEETISKASRTSQSQGSTIESDPPNIRITENREQQRKRKYSTSSAPASGDGPHEAEFASLGSNASSSQSTSRSIPTGSSRGSDSRRVIAPHTVSHLIPEQLAGMVFDRERNIWVKRKQVSGELAAQALSLPDDTDDDPFGDIPDLSVDEMEELQRLKAVEAKRKEEERAAHRHTHGHAKDTSSNKLNVGIDHIPHLGGNACLEDVSSSESLKATRKTSGITNPETSSGLTSREDERFIRHRSGKSSNLEIREELTEEVEKEIAINEDRIQPSSPQRRNVTISFSSPLASVILPSAYEELDFDHGLDEASQLHRDDHEDSDGGSVVISKRRSAHQASVRTGGTFRNPSRGLPLGGRGFFARPVSRIDEQDEGSASEDNDGQRRRSVSIVVATPISARVSSRPCHEIGTLELTPLSDFTVHHGNESFGLEVSYVERGQRYTLGNDSKRALSLSIKDIVARITEVEPFEPFWEHIKEMDMKGKKLTNLHKLDEFCGGLEELDVSDNQISQLNGAPQTIRHLRITHNYLSDLTAWGHLSNLQYIDVSNNEIESLSSFKYLVHLRGLRADNNKIKSLDGIGNLDGLLSLRLRGNLVESVDFNDTKLRLLSDLDLNGNRIRDVQNLHVLNSLSSLNLEDNDICMIETSTSQELLALKYLKLSGNNLESIDVSKYPNLRLLYLDGNRLGNVTGLSRTKHLDSLSMREQQEGSVINHSFLSEAFEVRKLFLSGNFLGTFEPPIDFLNLQYLELANCGLESLPVDFGQIFPNTRVLNLNFNALKDIRPLLGIVRLKKVHLAGNRILKLRTTTNVLAQFPTLTRVDLRSNPLTQGFYAPVVETRLTHREGAETDDIFCEPFTLGNADMEKDKKYTSRLDMETRMLRRVYEMLVLGRSERLNFLDGLPVDISITVAKDKICEALIRAGIVQTNFCEVVEEAAQEEDGMRPEPAEIAVPEESIKEQGWQAEDSFA
jgi:protein NUD1